MRGTPLWGRLFYRLTGGRPGDHRDWPAIEAWGEEIARALPVPGGPAGSAMRGQDLAG
jgi:menaquinone-dependent protoporphyrinogen oxidase